MDTSPGQHLQNLVDKADLDAALANLVAEGTLASEELADFERLRLANLTSEVLDYGGRYDEAQRAIMPFADEATHSLTTFTEKPIQHLSPTDADLYHQYCYVLINQGMCIYRHAQYLRDEFNRSRVLFELAQRGLVRLEELGYSHRGALSRAWYCLGLIHRELYKYAEARKAFAQAIELGAQAIARPDRVNQQPRYRYSMSKCYGLGNAWISYTEASLSEAQCHIVAARLLLATAKANARYIAAYLDLVNATIVLSSASTLGLIQKGIGLLRDAYEALGGDDAIGTIGVGHGPYAIRVANDLASAYLKCAHACTGQERDDHIAKALSIVRQVRISVHAQLDSRSRCKTYVLESRIHREAGRYDEALVSAQAALDLGGQQEFSRVDCWLTLGEAKYHKHDYRGAVEAFENALRFGATNRKMFAACHLHLSRTYLNSNEPSKARHHFNIWDSTLRALENSFIRALRDEVWKGIQEIDKDFIREAQVSDLNADIHINALRHWLAEVALNRTGNDNPKAAAVLLGVSESTVANWLNLYPEANTRIKQRRKRAIRGA